MRLKNLPAVAKAECVRALCDDGMDDAAAEAAWNAHEDTACAAAAVLFMNHLDQQNLMSITVRDAMTAWRSALATWALKNLK